VIDLEMLLDEAREQYEQLLKNSSNKSLQVFRPSSHSPSLSFFLSFFSSPTHAFVLPPARVQKRNMFLERNLEQLTRVHQQLVNQNNELRLEKKVSEKKLAARNERIRGLEVLLSSAQEKLQQQSEKYATHTHTHDTTHDTHYTHSRVSSCADVSHAQSFAPQPRDAGVQVQAARRRAQGQAGPRCAPPYR
jgi:hypothetical protein